MARFKGRKDDIELLGSPQEAMGFSKEYSALLQNFIIKKYDFSSLDQIEDIKKQLLGKRILIINSTEILKNSDISEVKRVIEELKSFLRENGGSIGDQYLIVTPNSYVKIAN